MKPNPKITKKVKESISDLRFTLIQSTVKFGRQASYRSNDVGALRLSSPAPIVSTCVKDGRIVTESMLVDRLYYWYGDNYYMVGNGDEHSCHSGGLSLDSLVAVYNAVRKTLNKY